MEGSAEAASGVVAAEARSDRGPPGVREEGGSAEGLAADLTDRGARLDTTPTEAESFTTTEDTAITWLQGNRTAQVQFGLQHLVLLACA